MAEVLVLAERTADGEVKKVTLELLTAARRLGSPSAVWTGPGSDPGGGGTKAPGFEDGGGAGRAPGELIPMAVVLPRRAFRSILGFFALSSAIGSSEAGQQVAIDGHDLRSAHGREPRDRSAR